MSGPTEQPDDDDLAQDAARFIELDVRFLNSLLLAKYCLCIGYLALCVLLLYGAQHDGALYQGRARLLLMLNTSVIAFSLALFSVTRLWPYQARRWLGWLPVLVLRWNWLAKPNDLRRYVRGATDCTSDTKELTEVTMRRAAVGLAAASVWSMEMTLNAVGLSHVCYSG
jgi:hypothetical protein